MRLNCFSFSTLLLSLEWWVGGCLCGFSWDFSLTRQKMVVLFGMADFLWHTWHLSHSLVRCKWVLKSFGKVKISQCQGSTCKTQVLFSPWEIESWRGSETSWFTAFQFLYFSFCSYYFRVKTSYLSAHSLFCWLCFWQRDEISSFVLLGFSTVPKSIRGKSTEY